MVNKKNVMFLMETSVSFLNRGNVLAQNSNSVLFPDKKYPASERESFLF